jgi:hypothetical protein
MAEMEYFSIVIVVALVLLVLVLPAVWSSDPARRADAREILRMLLTAFGRRRV